MSDIFIPCPLPFPTFIIISFIALHFWKVRQAVSVLATRLMKIEVNQR